MLCSPPIYTKIMSIEKEIFSFLVVFMAWAHTYALPGVPISIGEFLMVLFIPVFCKRGMLFPLEKQECMFVLYFFYMAITSLFLIVVFDAPIFKLFSIFRVGFYWMIIFYFGKNLFDKVFFVKWMYIFSVILSLLIILQLVTFLMTGYFISGIISNIPLNRSETAIHMYQHTLDLARWRGFLRPNGFLQEPGYCCQFLFICMVTLIFDKGISFRKKIYFGLLLSVAIIISQSTSGLVLLVLSYIMFFYLEKKLFILKFFILFVFIALFLFYFVGNNSSGFWAFDRIINVANSSEIDGSANLRLYNGFEVFEEIPFIYKIIGTGEGLFEYVLYNLNLDFRRHYMNTFSGVLFSTGLIGLFIWLFAQFTLFIKSNLYGKCLVIGFFILSMGESIYCQPQMVWFILLILADVNEKFFLYKKKEFTQ